MSRRQFKTRTEQWTGTRAPSSNSHRHLDRRTAEEAGTISRSSPRSGGRRQPPTGLATGAERHVSTHVAEKQQNGYGNAPSGRNPQPADHDTEQDTSDDGVRAKQHGLPEHAERCAVQERHAGTPTAPRARRDVHHDEHAERTGPGIRTHHAPAPRIPPHGSTPSVAHAQIHQQAPSVPAPETHECPGKKNRRQGTKSPNSTSNSPCGTENHSSCWYGTGAAQTAQPPCERRDHPPLPRRAGAPTQRSPRGPSERGPRRGPATSGFQY